MIAREIYDTLGVPPSASQDDVRRAYRRAAKRAHPDSGGSREAWQRLEEAHRVLSDPDLRTRYDQTGEVPPHARRAGEIDVRVVNILGEVVRSVVASPADLDGQPVIEQILESLARKRQEFMVEYDAVRRFGRRVEILQRRKRRKRRRGRNASNDILSLVLEGQLRQNRQDQANCEEKLRVHDQVVDILRQYDYSHEVREAVRASFVTIAGMGPGRMW